jgi:hypothetical protein
MTRIKRVPHLPDRAIRMDIAQRGVKLVHASIECPDDRLLTCGVVTAAGQRLIEVAFCLTLLITFGLELLLARLSRSIRRPLRCALTATAVEFVAIGLSVGGTGEYQHSQQNTEGVSHKDRPSDSATRDHD